MNRTLRLAAVLLLTISISCGKRSSPEWAVPSLPCRILVEVPAAEVEGRASDAFPASLDVDFNSAQFSPLQLTGPVDLDSIQVIRYDPSTGKPLPAPPWPFSRSEGERVSRFLDKSLPWEFPRSEPRTTAEKVKTFPRGAFLVNAKGSGNPGLLVWDHLRENAAPSYYAIYFDTLKPGERQKPPRQGFIGDGSPRRDVENESLSGSLYNRVALTDWDGDGLFDLLVGVGFGQVLRFRNEGDSAHPKFGQAEFVFNSEGKVLYPGPMASPAVADWNGDGVEDLVVGIETLKSVVWYQNISANSNRKLVYRGYVQADGQDIIVPPKPNPESPHYKKDYAPAVDVVDWDGDGDLDLLLGGYITGYIWYYENVGRNPDGTPTLKFRGPLEADRKPIDTIWGAHPCAVDLDGDGDLDLLTGSFGQAMGGGDKLSEFLIYYENIGTRTQPKLTRKPLQYEGDIPKDILAQPRAVDFNRDGLIDLVISTMQHVYLARNVGTKQLPKFKVTMLKSEWGLAPLSATQLIDLNRDGKLDIIRSPLDGDSSPETQLNEGKGTHGVFGPPQPLLPKGQEISHPQPYGDPWAFTFLCDFDGDGDLDLLWADGPGYVYLHRNNGNSEHPSFDTKGEKLMTVSGKPIKVGPPVVPVDQVKDFTVMQGSRASVTAIDFDGDGKTDLAVGDTYGDIYYFANTGTNEKPLFAQGVKLGNIGSRAIPLTYDWDRDGRPDIVGISWSERMEWYRNLGPGATPRFAAPQKLELPPTVMYSPRMLVADWNQDGDDDFLIMSSYPWFCWLDGSYVKHGYAAARILMTERRQ